MKAFLAFAMTLSALSFGAEPIETSRTTTGISNFGFELFRTLHESKTTEPVAISPLGIAGILELVMKGAEGQTQQELVAVLHWGKQGKNRLSAEQLSSDLSLFRYQLKAAYDGGNGGFEFTNATGFWGNTNPEVGFRFSGSYLDKFKKEDKEKDKKEGENRDVFATFASGDFAQPETAADINNWFAKQTKGKVLQIVESFGPPRLSSDASSVLLNMAYPKGNFIVPFSQIENGPFTDSTGKVSDVTFLSRSGAFPYFESEDYRMVSVAVGDYRPNGSVPYEIALDIITARSAKIDEAVRNLSGRQYEHMVSNLKSREIALSIPAARVNSKSGLKLGKLLKQMGAGMAFGIDAELRPLGSIAYNRNFYLEPFTKISYEVTPFGFETEEGKVYRAVSGARPSETRFFKVDGPSIQVIRHIKTGLPLLIVLVDAGEKYSQERMAKLNSSS